VRGLINLTYFQEASSQNQALLERMISSQRLQFKAEYALLLISIQSPMIMIEELGMGGGEDEEKIRLRSVFTIKSIDGGETRYSILFRYSAK
jgi:hypothetical protein